MSKEGHEDEYALIPNNKTSSTLTTKIILIASVVVVVISIAVSLVLTIQVGKLNNLYYTSSNAEKDCEKFSKGFKYDEVVDYDQQRDIIIRNANIYVNGNIFLGELLLRNGRIAKISKTAGSISQKADDIVIDAEKSIVTPGLIDVHSHGGVYSMPADANGNADGNEMTHPTFPAVRVIDGFNPHDLAFKYMINKGLTTIQTLPGSGNIMGGQGLIAKLRGKTVEEMRVKNAPVTLKMACGENPKRIYGNKGVTPMSRMGSAYQMRKAFSDALDLYNRQKDYCDKSTPNGMFPNDIFYTNLIELIRGNAVLNIHCYKVVDLEMAMRVTNEFGVTIDIFHHAHESYKIPQELKKRNISSAMFSDSWGYKLEAYEASIDALKILDESGVNVIIKTDHPVVRGGDLLFQAQKATHWGLNPTTALNSVTINAARALKLAHRIGSIEENKDADIVIWDRHPLHLGASPRKVIIEGHIVYEDNIPVKTDLLSYHSPVNSSKLKTSPDNLCTYLKDNTYTLNEYLITNATIYTGTEVITGGEIYVKNGIVMCVKKNCNTNLGIPTFFLEGGEITPGLILAGLNLGLLEIDQENNWGDGIHNGGLEVTTLHGITLNTKHIHVTWKDGVLTGVAMPRSSKMFAGSSASYNLGPGIELLTEDYVLNAYTALDINIGNKAKSDIASISEQIFTLKKELKKALNTSSGPLYDAINGKTPIIFWVDSADYILSILRALEESLGKPEEQQIQIVFGSAAEIHLVADQVKEWNASALIRRCSPWTFETRRCSFGDNISVLKQKDIKFGVIPSDEDNSFTRGIIWEAGLASEYGLSKEEAIATVTSNIADILNLPKGMGRIQEGNHANFVAYTGNPLRTNSIIELIGIQQKVECRPIEEI